MVTLIAYLVISFVFFLLWLTAYKLIFPYLSMEPTDAGALLTFGWGLYGQVIKGESGYMSLNNLL